MQDQKYMKKLNVYTKGYKTISFLSGSGRSASKVANCRNMSSKVQLGITNLVAKPLEKI
jgi:hypothetical protein